MRPFQSLNLINVSLFLSQSNTFELFLLLRLPFESHCKAAHLMHGIGSKIAYVFGLLMTSVGFLKAPVPQVFTADITAGV